MQFVAGQPEITRNNLAQIVAVTAEISGGYDLGSTAAAVNSIVARPGFLPNDVYYQAGGAYKQQQLAARGMIKVFIAAVIGEAILLLYLYENFCLPVIIIVSSLISTSAVFFGLWLTGVELNITAMMGMVMIVGIATEMAVFLVSEYQELQKELPPRDALHEAALNRMRPIAMSTLAMILALLPLGAAISGSGDQMLQPLAIAIISGITVQLPLVLLALPAVIGLTISRLILSSCLFLIGELLQQCKLNDTPRQRKVGDTAPVMAVNPPRNGPAQWTKTKAAGRSDGENSFVRLVERTFHNKPGRHQTGAAKCLLHRVDSPSAGTPRKSKTASKLSQAYSIPRELCNSRLAKASFA